ncbi:hypothetical protein [uncultured Aquimonas sp.]|jgi:hypothetical protein|uniref:hypothetical protein n=1 Tax=uncultured Aquimonas sp. TaxID=385483 RepID=UPI0008694CAE|nr:hypothetical protein [uncultured Aquimonas sp.]ODU46430.1 MAG: hypothetical protein ABS96_09130 [Xanthomonadaceae bacterium SCN 69-123]
MDILSMFLLLLVTGIGLSGATGYLIFGPLAYRHLQDRKATVGGHAFSPAYLGFLLQGRFRALQDRNLNGLATPAQVLLWCAIFGIVGAVVLLLVL